MVRVGEKFRKYRKVAGKTQEETAEKAGISLGYYKQLEKGVSDPSFNVALKICEALYISPNDLLPQSDKNRALLDYAESLRDDEREMINRIIKSLKIYGDSEKLIKGKE